MLALGKFGMELYCQLESIQVTTQMAILMRLDCDTKAAGESLDIEMLSEIQNSQIENRLYSLWIDSC